MARICLVALIWCLLAGCAFSDLRRPGGQAPPAVATAPGDTVQAEPEMLVAVSPVAVAEDCGEPLVGEEPEAEALDAETLEDLALLAEADRSAPEEEGETVVEEAVAFDLPMVENAKVRHFVEYYSGPGRHGFRRWLERSGRYLPMMREIFAEQGLPLDLTYLAMIESGFNPRACSRANAVGPWQFMASTGKVYGLGNDWAG